VIPDGQAEKIANPLFPEGIFFEDLFTIGG
jgi:hypothetical protein